MTHLTSLFQFALLLVIPGALLILLAALLGSPKHDNERCRVARAWERRVQKVLTGWGQTTRK
jgi:hypothetical protein